MVSTAYLRGVQHKSIEWKQCRQVCLLLSLGQALNRFSPDYIFLYFFVAHKGRGQALYSLRWLCPTTHWQSEHEPLNIIKKRKNLFIKKDDNDDHLSTVLPEVFHQKLENFTRSKITKKSRSYRKYAICRDSKQRKYDSRFKQK